MISIALATYNGERFIEQQLDSLRQQTLPADEVVICDDCSSDSTVNICRSFIEKHSLTGWRVEQNEANLGYCMNFYRAVGKCRGDIIFLCDQDDVWYPEKLKCMTDIMNSEPELKLLACRYRLIDGGGERLDRVSIHHYSADFSGTEQKIAPEELIGHSYIRGCSSCFRSELLSLLKPLEMSSLLGHDWQLAMLASLSGKAEFINLPLMDYRCHDSNASFSAKPVRKKEKRLRGLRESIEGHKYILSLARDESLKKELERFIGFEERRSALLENRKFFRWLAMGADIRQYSRYYGGNGLRVWLGDLLYPENAVG